MEISKKKDSLLVTGIFKYLQDNEANFINPIKTGMRPVIWIDNKKVSTSIHIITESEIYPGEQKEISIVILSPYIFRKDFIKGKIFTIGKPGYEIGKFEFIKIIKYWDKDKLLDFKQ